MPDVTIPAIGAIAPWYGSNRLLGSHVGTMLRGCEWVGVPFCGGLCELPHVAARTVLVSDLHRHLINLARVVADQSLNPRLRERLDATPFHPDTLARSQHFCRLMERDDGFEALPPDAPPNLDWACDYFVCSWMARNATAGTSGEFDAGLSTRWEAGGGDSAVRFRNATLSLVQWQAIMRRCTFVCLDVFDFLEKVKDRSGMGLYLDSPFPGPGDKYKHRFTEAQQRRLARRLAEFRNCKVVNRYYDHPLVRELYPGGPWRWHYLDGRKQSNARAPEVLIVNEPGTTALFQLGG